MDNYFNLLMPAVQDRPWFVWDSLNTVGWGSRVRNLEAGSYRVKKLYIPSLTAPRSHISHEALFWLRNKFLNSNSINSFHDHGLCERIYVARDDAPVRNVLNGEEMDDLMCELGFKKITMSGRSVAEQAKIFSAAKFIVGIHGAALANIAFCQKGSTFCEVFMDGWFTKAFFNLSRDLDMNYGCFLARNDNDNLYIDINQLRVLLLKMTR